jgi:signal peptidase I
MSAITLEHETLSRSRPFRSADPTTVSHRPRRRPQRGPSLNFFTKVLFVAVSVSVLLIVGWVGSGGRLLTMTTPSMCPNACVGSLVAVRPLTGPVHVGQLVSFRPPGQSQIFTHRVSALRPDGSFLTKGDAEQSPDPWVITRSEVVGRVSFTLWGIGWWLKALPLVAIGTALLLLSRPRIRAGNRRAWERLWGTMIVAVPLFLLHPLVDALSIQTVSDPHHKGWVSSLVVNTGLLPAQLHVVHGQVLNSFSASQLHLVSGPSSARAPMTVHAWASLPWWGWAVGVLVVLSPLLAYMARQLRTSDHALLGDGPGEGQ